MDHWDRHGAVAVSSVVQSFLQLPPSVSPAQALRLSPATYTGWVKKIKLFRLKLSAEFSLRPSVFVAKYCQFVADLYLFIFTNFGRFILVCIKIALVFSPKVLAVFTISSFEFQQIKLWWRHCQGWVVPNSLDLSPLDYHVRRMLESYHMPQQKTKIVPEFKDTLQLTWSALLEKAILTTPWKTSARQACVPANSGHFKHTMW